MRVGQTLRVMQLLLTEVKLAAPDAVVETVALRSTRLATCRGCTTCFHKGEDRCPNLAAGDDFPGIVARMDAADAVIFAVPNYALQVTWLLKNFLDRGAYIFHRPRFHRKAMLSVVVQAIFGGEAIVKYLDRLAWFWGFRPVRGVVVNAPWGAFAPRAPWPAQAEAKIRRTLQQAARGLVNAARRELAGPVQPDLVSLLFFSLRRSGYRNHAAVFDKPGHEFYHDFDYFRRRGWTTSAYYYPVRLAPHRAAIAWLADRLLALMPPPPVS